MPAHREVPDGLDLDAVARWLGDRTELRPPLRARLLPGGRSNLTYGLEDGAGRRVVLRRPPLHGVLPSAHDVAREHRILSALAASQVPVPRCLGLEETGTVTGAPFYVMEHVDGIVVRDRQVAADGLGVAVRAAASRDLIDVLVRLHTVDLEEVGLATLARQEEYLGRQLRRWKAQLDEVRSRDVGILDEVHARLAARIPAQGPATLVHGDYRLDNLLIDPGTGRVTAVLDWELATLGDPLADVGLLLVYWAEPDEQAPLLPDLPTLTPGFLGRDALLERYAAGSGRDLSEVGYYVAFGLWKLACILEGVHRRQLDGAYGRSAEEEGFGPLVLQLGEQAARAAAEVGR
ncbi:MAG: phosphotransferase family protein [Nitriliruptoraceae bacterium]